MLSWSKYISIIAEMKNALHLTHHSKSFTNNVLSKSRKHTCSAIFYFQHTQKSISAIFCIHPIITVFYSNVLPRHTQYTYIVYIIEVIFTFPDAVRVEVISFGGSAKRHVNFTDDTQNEDSIIKAIHAIKVNVL